MARTASGFTISSSRAKISRLSSRRSGTASMTSSHSARSSSSLVKRTRACSASCVGLAELAARHRPVGGVPQHAPARVDASAGCSRPPTTSMPLRANTSTMPAPMVPSPITPTSAKFRAMPGVCQRVRTASGGERGEGHLPVATPRSRPRGGGRITGCSPVCSERSPPPSCTAPRRSCRPPACVPPPRAGRARRCPRDCGPGACTPWAWPSTGSASSPRSPRCAPCRCSSCSPRSPPAWPSRRCWRCCSSAPGWSGGRSSRSPWSGWGCSPSR